MKVKYILIFIICYTFIAWLALQSDNGEITYKEYKPKNCVVWSRQVVEGRVIYTPYAESGIVICEWDD